MLTWGNPARFVLMANSPAVRTFALATAAAFAVRSDSRGIRRENTTPGTPKHNAPVENSIWRAGEAGHAARMEVSRLFQNVQPETVKNVRSTNGGRL